MTDPQVFVETSEGLLVLHKAIYEQLIAFPLVLYGRKIDPPSSGFTLEQLLVALKGRM